MSRPFYTGNPHESTHEQGWVKYVPDRTGNEKRNYMAVFAFGVMNERARVRTRKSKNGETSQ